MASKRPAEGEGDAAPAEKAPRSQRLVGRRALVTGGAEGIGLAIAECLAADGAAVTVADLKAAETTSASIATLICDCGDAAAIKECCEKAGPIDILVNNVGIQPPSCPCHETPLEDWTRVMTVNITSHFLFSKLLLPHMLEKSKGVIINTASVQGSQSQPGIPAYAASKGAVLSLTRQLAVEYAAKGVRVLSVSPGTIRTPLVERIFERMGSSSEAAGAVYPMKRIGETEEIGKVVAFLASDDAAFMTGENVTVDGGIMALGGWAQVA